MLEPKYKKGDILIVHLSKDMEEYKLDSCGNKLVYVCRNRRIKEGTIVKIVCVYGSHGRERLFYDANCYYKGCGLYEDELRKPTKKEVDRYFLMRFKDA